VAVESHKHLVRRLVQEGVNEHNLDVLDDVAEGAFAEVARRWIAPFRGPFPDFEMEIVNLVEEDDVIVAHFRCSGTHLGIAPTGRRFEQVDEIYIFRVRNGRLASAVGVEDNVSRLRQLGIGLAPPGSRSALE
jgi:predicted ester cyclase